MKYLTPEALAAAIIGKGGAVIADLRKDYSAQLALTDKTALYMHTDCRVLTMQANDEESLNKLTKEVINKIGELVKAGSPSEGLGTEGELKLRVLMPRAAVGGVIGKEGKNIKEIQKSCGARISINEPAGTGPGADQLVLVAGPAAALEYVLTEVNKQVQMVGKEPWFQTWASANGTVQAGAGGAGQLGWGGAPPAMYSPGIDLMVRVAQGMPPYVMEDSRGFAMSCVVPNRFVGGLIGRSGSGTKEVQNATGTQISIRERPDDPDNRTLNITGPLSNTCAAYMLMMKRYLDAEKLSSQGGGQ